MVRSFLAADLPGTIHDAIEKTIAGLRVSGRDIKWVNVRNIHLTLKFFGDIEEGQIDAISCAVRDAVAEVQPVSLQAAGIGAFPSLTRPRVIWVGVGGESGRLVLMQKRIDDTLASLGFPAEMRPFSPHLTVGRIRPGAKAPDLAGRTERVRDVLLGSFTVREVVLYQSVLRPSGAVYTALRRMPLAVGDDAHE